MAEIRPETELDLSDYLQILRKRWRWAALGFVAVIAASIAFPLLQADTFTADTRVLISPTEAESAVDSRYQDTSLLSRSLTNELSLAEGDEVRNRVVDTLGQDVNVTVSTEDFSDVLRFRAVSDTAAGAAEAANIYAATYVSLKREQSAASIDAATELFNSELETLGEEREELRADLVRLENDLARATTDARISQLERDIAVEESRIAPKLNLIDARITSVANAIIELSLSGELAAVGSARVVTMAVEPTSPSNTPLSRSLALGIVAGGIVGVAAALLAHSLNRSLNSADDVRQITDLPVLGTVPKGDQMARPALDMQTLENPESDIGDAYHRVRTALQFTFLNRDVRSVLITSANPTEGKTTSAINLAGALSAIGSRVILADVDFRRPRLHEVFDIKIMPGLSDHLLDGTPLHALAYHVARENHSMVVLPSGSTPPSPGDLVSTPAFADLIRLVEKEGDVAVFDAPPILPVSDAVTLSRLVDSVVITAKAGETTQDDLSRTIETLRQVGAEIAGIVLVGVTKSNQYYRYKDYAATPR